MNLNRSILPVAVVALFLGCSQQGEGERCVRANNDADCASGLVCWSASELESEYASKFPADRCCPSDLKTATDARCTKKSSDDTTSTPTNGTAGAASTTSNGTGGGSAGASQAGGAPSAGGAGNDAAGSAGLMSSFAGSAGSGE